MGKIIFNYDGSNFTAGLLLGLFAMSPDTSIWMYFVIPCILVNWGSLYGFPDYTIVSYKYGEGWRFFYKKSPIVVD